MFRQMIENYLRLLTPELIKKYALNNGIILNDEEACNAVIFIKAHYLMIFENPINYQKIIELINNSFDTNSSNKMIQLLEISKNKYHIN